METQEQTQQDTIRPIFSGPTYIIIAALLWALDGILRRSLGGVPPLHIIFFEHLVGALILLPIGFVFFGQTKITKKEWGIIALVSLLSGLLGTLFFTAALLKTMFISFSVVFLLQKLQPIFAILTARIFLKEPVSKKYIGWAMLALLAAYFVTFPNGIVNLSTGTGTVVAALLALGAAIAWGSSTTFSKMALADHNSTLITAIRFWMTTFMALAAILISGAGSTLAWPTGSEALRYVIIALSTGMVALLLYYRGLKVTPVRISTILELTFPLVAILIDVFLYHSVLVPTQYLAGFVLLFAMYRISRLGSAE
jgi:drug/metabolite transporter (DMT)-like permease